jgi:PAS domain S-box-containing protein
MTELLSPAAARALWEVADVALVVSSRTGIQFANPAFLRLLRVEPDDFSPVDLAVLAYRDDRPRVLAALAAALDEGAVPPPHDVRLRGHEGALVAVEHAIRPMDVEGHRLAVSTFVPVGDRNRLADALSASEQRYRALFEEDLDGRFVVTPDWRVIDANAVLARMLGFVEGAELVGRGLLELTPDGPILQKLLAVTRVERRAGPAELQMERAGGGLIDVLCSLAGSHSETGALVSLHGQVQEITERKRLETRLQGAERMEAIGRLAGGLAHDFNNLLTVISGNSERLLEGLADNDPFKNAVVAIDQAAARAASMTRQLLAYGRRQVFELRPLSLETLVTDARPLLSEVVGAHIDVQLQVEDGLPQISADPRQLEHVIANLAVNAREAMPSGGALTIGVDAIEIGGVEQRERVWLRPGRYVRLVVHDTGLGMDAVTKAYAFQPFYTTKRMGNGRGLGLATVYGIVKQSHGFVWVESEPEHGARFTILFPAIKSDRADAPRDQAAPAETILVVEQDGDLRMLVGEALRRRDYQVLDAASGSEALGVFASHPSRIHLVVSERSAVTAQGAPLMARLKAIDPLVQICVMLDASDVLEGGQRVLPTTPSIQKPFTLQALADKVREVLDSGEGRS